MTTWDEIKDSVEKNGNVKTVTMEELRDAIGALKLGVRVRSDISKALAGMGLGHVPQELPSNQEDRVRLYKYGTPVGELIGSVLTPSEQNDGKLVEQCAGGSIDYAAIVEKIRELVEV